MHTSEVTIHIALDSESARIASAYAAWNYSGGISPDDTAWLAEIADECVGLAKIAPTDAPPFLSSRLANYKHQGLDVILMARSV